MTQLILILDNVRSAHNVGSIIRSADAFGVEVIYACGITPYPQGVIGSDRDSRDPIVRRRNHREIAKTALGAEQHVRSEHYDDTLAAIADCRNASCTIIGLEQNLRSVNVRELAAHSDRAALVVGNEVSGLSSAVIDACDVVVEIPQRGRKESLNVAVATGIALHQITSPNHRL